jgi:hypothetical protein
MEPVFLHDTSRKILDATTSSEDSKDCGAVRSNAQCMWSCPIVDVSLTLGNGAEKTGMVPDV